MRDGFSEVKMSVKDFWRMSSWRGSRNSAFQVDAGRQDQIVRQVGSACRFDRITTLEGSMSRKAEADFW